MNFEQRLKEAPIYQQERYERLIKYFENVNLADEEKGYLLWLSGWDDETESMFASLFLKLKNKERK